MPKIKINEEATADIREMRKNGASVKDIAAKYNIAVSTTFRLLRGEEKPKKAKRKVENCRYCETKISAGYVCSECGRKIKLVREILALGQVIRKCAEEERMQRDGC